MFDVKLHRRRTRFMNYLEWRPEHLDVVENSEGVPAHVCSSIVDIVLRRFNRRLNRSLQRGQQLNRGFHGSVH